MIKHILTSIKFETKADSELRHAHLTRIIASQDSPPDRLRKLAACSPKARCHLDGCPLCARKFRKQLIKEVKRLKLDQQSWTRASLILEGQSYPCGSLSVVNLKLTTNAVIKRLQRSNMRDALVIGGWDISLNTFENDDARWNLHLYLLINEPYSPALKKQVLKTFRLSSEAMRPQSVKGVASDEISFFKVTSYSNKILFSWRSGYFEPDRDRVNGSPRKNTRDHNLKPTQQLELTSWLSQYPMGARIILRNIKRRNPPWAKLRLELLTPMAVASPP